VASINNSFRADSRNARSSGTVRAGGGAGGRSASRPHLSRGGSDGRDGPAHPITVNAANTPTSRFRAILVPIGDVLKLFDLLFRRVHCFGIDEFFRPGEN